MKIIQNIFNTIHQAIYAVTILATLVKIPNKIQIYKMKSFVLWPVQLNKPVYCWKFT